MDGIDRDDARLALRQMLDYFGPATEGRAAGAVNAWCDRIRPALATPQPAQPEAVVITDDMVKRAAQAQADYEVAHWKKKCTPEEFRERMLGAARAALTAALTPEPPL